MRKLTLVTAKQFKQAAEAEREALGILKAYSVEKAIDEGARTIGFTISTADVDRENDTVAIDGWDFANYLKNPVVLWCHDYWSLPVGAALSIGIEADRVKSVAKFTEREENPLGDMVFRLYAKGFLHAVSVGFRPKEWAIVQSEQRPWGYDFKRQELLEYSACPVPANPAALIEARSMGIDTAPLKAWAERVLDEMGGAPAPGRKTLERLRSIADPAQAVAAAAAGEKTVILRAASLLEELAEPAAGEPVLTLAAAAAAATPEQRLAGQAAEKAIAAVGKVGRVLSRANEERLRQAHGSIGEVLAQLEKQDEEDEEAEEEGANGEGGDTAAAEADKAAGAAQAKSEPPADGESQAGTEQPAAEAAPAATETTDPGEEQALALDDEDVLALEDEGKASEAPAASANPEDALPLTPEELAAAVRSAIEAEMLAATGRVL
jgi:HK97 family phage prohead protease